MQRGGPRCKNHSCFHAFGRHAQRRADMQGWPPEMQKKISHPCMSASYYHVLLPNIVFASRTATLACRPCYSTALLYYFTILLFTILLSLQIQYCRGRCLGLAARDAKTNLHFGQPPLHVGPPTILLFCYCTPDTVLPRPMFGVGRPRCKNKFLQLGQPPLHVGPPNSTILLLCYFTISLQIQYCRGRCLGLAARDAKKQFASRTATLECSYITILLFYSFTLLLFYYFACSRYSAAAADVWGWPPEMQKKIPCTTTHYQIYYVLPRTAAERSFLHLGQPPLHVGPPILLFYYFTILLFHCRYSTAAALAARNAKK